MQKLVGFSTVVITALALLCQSAEAGSRRHRHHSDPRLTISSIGVGAAMTAAYFALRDWRWKDPPNAKMSNGGAMVATTFGCMALSPIVGTLVVNRPLTLREAHVMTADCVIPFVGGWLVNKAFDDHPEWEGKKPHKRHKRH